MNYFGVSGSSNNNNSGEYYSKAAHRILIRIDEAKDSLYEETNLRSTSAMLGNLIKQVDGIIKRFNNEISPYLIKGKNGVVQNGFFGKKLKLKHTPLVSNMDSILARAKANKAAAINENKKINNRKAVNRRSENNKKVADRRAANNRKKLAQDANLKKLLSDKLNKLRSRITNSKSRAPATRHIEMVPMGPPRAPAPPPPLSSTWARQAMNIKRNIPRLSPNQRTRAMNNPNFKNFINSGTNASTLPTDRIARIRNVIKSVKH